MITQPFNHDSIESVSRWWASIRPHTSRLFRLMATAPTSQSPVLLEAREALLREVYQKIVDQPHTSDVEPVRQLLLTAMDKYMDSVQQSKDDQYARSRASSQSAYMDLKTLCVLLMSNGVYETLPV